MTNILPEAIRQKAIEQGATYYSLLYREFYRPTPGGGWESAIWLSTGELSRWTREQGIDPAKSAVKL